MSLFILDTSGDQELLKTQQLKTPKFDTFAKHKLLEKLSNEQPQENSQEEDEYDLFGLPPPNVDISNIIENTLSNTRKKNSKVEEEMDYVQQAVEEAAERKNAPKKKNKFKRGIDLDHSDFNELTGKRDETEIFRTNVAKVMANTEMVPNLEQLKDLPSITKKKQRELSRKERSKTKGKYWFDMKAPEITEELENDLKILQMRSVLDPKHFYKKNDLKVLPKFFQVGTVQHSPLDYYHERDTRKNKKRTLVDELLADTEAQKYIKRKHKDIMAMKQKYAHRKSMKKMKQLKKKK